MLKKRIIKPLILFLLISQFATIAHAFEHDLTHEENEQCFVCIHKTDLSNALIDYSTSVGINLAGFEKYFFPEQTLLTENPSLYKNRSPPVVL